MRAATRADPRQLSLVVELVAAQAIGPNAGRVDDVRGAHEQLLATHAIARDHPGRPAPLERELLDGETVCADRAEALGLPEHGQDEADVVGLTVIEQVAGTRLARRERRQEIADLAAVDDAMARGAPALLGLCHRAPAAAARALAPAPGHHVVEVQPHADESIRARTAEGRDDDRQRPDEVRGERDEQLALDERFAHETQLELAQVAQAAVDELARAARCAAGVVVALEQCDAVAARSGIEGDAGAGDPAADHHHIEALGGERLECVGAGDHGSTSVPRTTAGTLRLVRAPRTIRA